MTEENKNLNDTNETEVKNDAVEETTVETKEEKEIKSEEVTSVEKQETKIETVSVPHEEEINIQTDKVTIFKKIQSIFSDKKKLGILAAVVIAFIALFSVMNGPTSVINDVKVSFAGYDERGTATYNEVEVKAKIAKIIAEKNGVKAPDVSNASKASASLNDILKNLFSGNTEYYKKLSAIKQQYRAVEISLDKTSNLKNGDTVTVTIKTGNNSPIKSETKTFTVSDLKPITKVDLQSVLSENVVSAVGYNGYGTLKYDSNIYTVKNSEIKNLKNGQKVEVQIKDSYIEKILKEGKIFDGNTSTTVEVKDLKELKTINNIAEVYTKVNDLAKSEYANKVGATHTYTIEKKDDFMKYTSSTSGKDKITVVSVYKINDKYRWLSEEKVEDYYVTVGYSNLDVFEESIILADLQYKTYSNSSKYTTADSANSYLKYKGLLNINVKF